LLGVLTLATARPVVDETKAPADPMGRRLANATMRLVFHEPRSTIAAGADYMRAFRALPGPERKRSR